MGGGVGGRYDDGGGRGVKVAARNGEEGGYGMSEDRVGDGEGGRGGTWQGNRENGRRGGRGADGGKRIEQGVHVR